MWSVRRLARAQHPPNGFTRHVEFGGQLSQGAVGSASTKRFLLLNGQLARAWYPIALAPRPPRGLARWGRRNDNRPNFVTHT
jgi:hypothetical protein